MKGVQIAIGCYQLQANIEMLTDVVKDLLVGGDDTDGMTTKERVFTKLCQ
ncbi:MAG: hypothetical protein OCC45_16105 [Desulfotalea sp.]